jgi:quinol-cytochrome oxidoreductase complex cytochrome b subunit
MTDAELKQFYEKLYFLELESREKVQGRLQLSLTLLLAVIGAVVFLFQNFDYQAGAWAAPRITFVFFLCVGMVLLAASMVFFVNAFYNNSYYLLPDSRKTADYKLELEETYKEFEQSNKLVEAAMDQYLTNYYIEYATFNTQTNDRRAAYVHLCNGALVGAAVLFIFAYVAFYFGELDKSKIKSATEVFVTKPVDVRLQDNRK